MLEPFWTHVGSMLVRTWSVFCSDLGQLQAALGSVLAAVLLGLLRFLRSLRGAAARIFPRLLRDRAGKPRENRRRTRETFPAQSAEAAVRSAAARLQTSVRARCLDALAVLLLVVLVLLRALS